MKSLIGDIGNTETKICVLDQKFKILKKIKLETFKLNKKKYLKNKFSFMKNKKHFNEKALFANVVPKITAVVFLLTILSESTSLILFIINNDVFKNPKIQPISNAS